MQELGRCGPLQTAPGGGWGSGGKTVSRGRWALGHPEGKALGADGGAGLVPRTPRSWRLLGCRRSTPSPTPVPQEGRQHQGLAPPGGGRQLCKSSGLNYK